MAVGVSGGADSMALLLLVRAWAAARPDTARAGMIALTVDHALRRGSADEADQVASWCAAIGVAHEILVWHHDEPVVSHVQERARAARYRLLTERCQALEIDALLVAHHGDDQAETVLMRLCKGSGVDGLAGMSDDQTLWTRQARPIRLLRPLLSYTHADLLGYCKAQGQTWIEDPSNHNPRFARSRLRAAREVLEAEGLSNANLLRLAHRAAIAARSLDQIARAALEKYAEVTPFGEVRFPSDILHLATEEVSLRILAKAIDWASRPERPVPRESLEALRDDLISRRDSAPDRTLSGCLVRMRRGFVDLAREPAAIDDHAILEPGERLLWDRRFLVTYPAKTGPESLTVRPLGQISAAVWDRVSIIPQDMPAPRSRASLPGLWRDTQLVAVPQIVTSIESISRIRGPTARFLWDADPMDFADPDG
ncbi:MAG: tRNA lysidine(34) synthetase TilS [Alphaproteobacteria bacterium]|nr:MAG: tRNA lysidine(34) synthetase TilS [Alphaproteobacteria bacterium]